MPAPFVVSPSAVLKRGFSNHLLEQGKWWYVDPEIIGTSV